MTTVGFLHVAAGQVEACRAIVAERAPWVSDVHLVDEALLDAAALGEAARLAWRAGVPAVAVEQLVDGPGPRGLVAG